MAEVVALGEVLIDFTPAGKSPTGNPLFERNPGGAPANVLSLLSKLGISTQLIGKIGDDMFGHTLKGILESADVGTDGLVLSKKYNTTLAFVELDEKGDRSFGFIRNNGADKMLTQEEVNLSLLNGAKVFHFGGVSLTDEPSRTATLSAAAEAKRRGLMISYDPNFRPPLWNENAKEVLLKGVKLADILKVSDEECRLLSGKENIAEGSAYLSKGYGPKLVFVTLGPKGSAFYFNGCFREQETFDVKTIDTTGAGDAFFGGILYCLLKEGKPLTEIAPEKMEKFMQFANAAGSLVTTKKGAIMSMPTLAQINNLINTI